MPGLVATAETDINATPVRVWQALTDPEQIKVYMFGSEVVTDWQLGRPIVWQGEYQGRQYQDKGEVVEFEENRRLTVTHFSPLSGQPDEPENYHTLTYVLDGAGGRTHLSLSQDNNGTADEAAHAKANWELMLAGLKSFVEGAPFREGG